MPRIIAMPDENPSASPLLRPSARLSAAGRETVSYTYDAPTGSARRITDGALAWPTRPRPRSRRTVNIVQIPATTYSRPRHPPRNSRATVSMDGGPPNNGRRQPRPQRNTRMMNPSSMYIAPIPAKPRQAAMNLASYTPTASGHRTPHPRGQGPLLPERPGPRPHGQNPPHRRSRRI
jgi:hypothetical protein